MVNFQGMWTLQSEIQNQIPPKYINNTNPHQFYKNYIKSDMYHVPCDKQSAKFLGDYFYSV